MGKTFTIQEVVDRPGRALSLFSTTAQSKEHTDDEIVLQHDL
jgi:hypothetical protein